MVKDISPGRPSSDLYELTAIGNVLYFTALDPSHGRELWKSDGTFTSTKLISDIAPDFEEDGPGDLIAVAGGLFFDANDGIHGRELWKFETS